MDSSLLSLSKIFIEKIFRIPDYQRGYAWTEKQTKEFFNDLKQLQPGKNHYTGVLTLENVSESKYSKWEDDLWIIESKNYSPYYIVDGQQRLTTSIILVQAILESIEVDTRLNYTSIDEIRKKFIFDSKDCEVSKSYLFGYEKDNPSYEFLKTEIFNEDSSTRNLKQETIYTLNLENTKKYFLNELSKMQHSEIEILYTKLTQNFLFNIYIISDDIDVFVAFETMNNRGKPLSHLELLKNRLIYLSTKFEVDEFEKGSLRKRINECWKTIYHNLGKNKEAPLDDDAFLINQFMIYFGEELENGDQTDELLHFQYSRLRRLRNFAYSDYLLEIKFTTKNLSSSGINISLINDYVKNLQTSVEVWYDIFNPKHSGYTNEIKKWLDKLNRQGISVIAPLIMVAFSKITDNNSRLELLKSLERFNFLTSLSKGTYFYFSIGQSDFMEWAIKLNKDKISLSTILKRLATEIDAALAGGYIIRDDQFNKKGFYGWDEIKYFLFEYDLSLAEASKTERKKLVWESFNSDDYRSVEHIYPKNSKAQCWTKKFSKYSTKQRNLLKNSLGNLLPLSIPKNSSLGNKCFQDKISSNENSVGYRYGCYSENELTEYDEWTANTILERGMKLLNFMESRWNFKIGNEKEKKKFLKLSFVKSTKPLTKK